MIYFDQNTRFRDKVDICVYSSVKSLSGSSSCPTIDMYVHTKVLYPCTYEWRVQIQNLKFCMNPYISLPAIFSSTTLIEREHSDSAISFSIVMKESLIETTPAIIWCTDENGCNQTSVGMDKGVHQSRASWEWML